MKQSNVNQSELMDKRETNSETQLEWWMEGYGFFGNFYMEGDNSTTGYLQNGQYSLNERTKMEVDGIVSLSEASAKDKFLDVPCGYGRHSIELARRGYEVKGSDINSIHLNAAMEYAKQHNIKVEFEQENMIEIGYSSQFDVLINMFYSFGFFKSDEENMQVLRNFYKALKVGGRFLMHTDVNIPRILNGKYKVDELRPLQSSNELRIIDNYNVDTKRIDGSWSIKRKDGSLVEREYSVRVYTKEEFVEMCLDAGFKMCKTYSDWSGTPYHEDSEDMMIVAFK